MTVFGNGVFGGGGGGGGASAFTDLTDVPSSYTGAALQSVRVNAGETGLEFAAASGGDYPVAVNIISVNTTLTTGQQGVIIVSPGVELTLPATAPNGTRYSIVPQGEYSLVGTVFGYGAGTIVLDRTLDLIGVNIPSLAWVPFNVAQPSAYDAARAYNQGDIALVGGTKFALSRSSNNVGNDPLTSDQWDILGRQNTESFNAYIDGTDSIAGGATETLGFDIESLASDNYDTGTFQYTVPLDGIYEFGYSLTRGDSTTENAVLDVSIVGALPGATADGRIYLNATASNSISASTGPITLTAATVVYVQATNSGASSHSVSGNFYGKRLI